MTSAKFLILEPFYGGSHKDLIDILLEEFKLRSLENDACLVTMPAKKWHWRARTGAIYFAKQIPTQHFFRVLFASSVLNLAELIALRPDLLPVRKVLYCHENQLVYPVKQFKERDFQYGYNQILSCLVADNVIFNSNFNKTSFLTSIDSFFKLQPDFRPKGLAREIEGKCSVLYFPIKIAPLPCGRSFHGCLHIVWPHRWEHDKNPEDFLEVLIKLQSTGHQFKVSVIGEQFSEVPEKFKVTQNAIADHIAHWGFVSKQDYFSILNTAHVVVSTSKHEFFGVAMLEAAICGCYPLCPNRLVYPEIYPPSCLYIDSDELLQRLSYMCQNVSSLENMVSHLKIDLEKFTCKCLIPEYMKLFNLE